MMDSNMRPLLITDRAEAYTQPCHIVLLWTEISYELTYVFKLLNRSVILDEPAQDQKNGVLILKSHAFWIDQIEDAHIENRWSMRKDR
jgi:hypothetical protein